MSDAPSMMVQWPQAKTALDGEDLIGLPPGCRLLLVARDWIEPDESDIIRMTERFTKMWQQGERVLPICGCDVFIVTPDGKITGTGSKQPELKEIQ